VRALASVEPVYLHIFITHTTGATKENYLALPLDVTKTDSITSAISKAQETFGRLDVVVNNAFVSNSPKPLLHSD